MNKLTSELDSKKKTFHDEIDKIKVRFQKEIEAVEKEILILQSLSYVFNDFDIPNFEYSSFSYKCDAKFCIDIDSEKTFIDTIMVLRPYMIDMVRHKSACCSYLPKEKLDDKMNGEILDIFPIIFNQRFMVGKKNQSFDFAIKINDFIVRIELRLINQIDLIDFRAVYKNVRGFNAPPDQFDGYAVVLKSIGIDMSKTVWKELSIHDYPDVTVHMPKDLDFTLFFEKFGSEIGGKSV